MYVFIQGNIQRIVCFDGNNRTFVPSKEMLKMIAFQ